MSQAKTSTSVQKVPFGEKIAYGLGDAGCNFIWTTVGMFLTVYYTDKVGISAAIVGTIMLLTRLLDGVSDLVIEGMTYSASSFGMKVGTGIGSAVVGWGLALGGYFGEAAVQSASALFAIKALYTWVPMILIILGTVVLAACNLDKIYPTIRKELAERNQH